VNHSDSETRRQLLQAALKSFAERGYAATSVRQIVAAAGVSKPALYYYFKDKAGLFDALVDQAHDQRYGLIQEAAQRGQGLAEKIEEIATAIFDFSVRNRDLMRLAFATAFSASGKAPGQTKCLEKGKRTFEFIRSLMEAGQVSGELDRRFSVEELAMGIYGQLNSHVMVRLLVPDCHLDRKTAQQIVRLFLQGAAGSKNLGNGDPRGFTSQVTRRTGSTHSRNGRAKGKR
jgi:TetR/AcrR family transcriptional regulator